LVLPGLALCNLANGKLRIASRGGWRMPSVCPLQPAPPVPPDQLEWCRVRRIPAYAATNTSRHPLKLVFLRFGRLRSLSRNAQIRRAFNKELGWSSPSPYSPTSPRLPRPRWFGFCLRCRKLSPVDGQLRSPARTTFLFSQFAQARLLDPGVLCRNFDGRHGRLTCFSPYECVGRPWTLGTTCFAAFGGVIECSLGVCVNTFPMCARGRRISFSCA